jgi:hypothetical protein
MRTDRRLAAAHEHPHRPSGITIAASSIIGLLLLTAPSAALAGDAPVIANPATPRDGVETWQLTELWRAGGEDDDLFFGSIQDVKADENGDLYVVDMQIGSIHVYSPHGEHLRTITREGDGPGEVREPYTICFWPDDTIAIGQRHAGKLVRVDRQGIPASSIDLMEHLWSVNTLMRRGGNLVIVGQYGESLPGGQRQHFVLAGYEPDGTQRCIYEEKLNELTWENFTLIEKNFYCARQRTCALGPDGHVYAASERNHYRINVYAPDATLTRTIEREFEPLRRTKLEIERNRAAFEDDVRNVDFEKHFVIEEVEQVLHYLRVDDDGNVWVLHGRSDLDQPAGVMCTFDVFDPSGLFIKQVAIACEGDAENDEIGFVEDGRLVLLKGSVGGGRVLGDVEDAVPLELIVLAPPAESAAGL